MGEHQVKELNGETGKPAEFTPRLVLTKEGQAFQLQRSGKVYGVRMQIGARVHDQAVIDLVHGLARETEAKEAAAAIKAGRAPAVKGQPARKAKKVAGAGADA